MRTRHGLVLRFLVASGMALPAGLLMGANVWTIPGTVNAAGQNNTRFVSDLAVTNPGSGPVVLTISLIPANGTTPSPVTLPAGVTVVYRNVLDRVWGVQGSGATQVSSDAPLLIRARTYNTAASGTYGVALPVFADDRLLSVGDTADSLWISQSADAGSGYRTNVAVVFPDDGGGTATVTIFDADGNLVGTRRYGLDAPGFQQVSVASFAGAVPVGRAEIVVTGGRAAGYSVVVDNVTGDSSLFTFEELPAGNQDVLVNGVSRANGKNDTFFRTDGRFYNPASEDATVTVAFHAKSDSNPSPVTRDFIVPAGKIRDVVDVLDSLLSLPVGSSGALRFSSETPVAILCRTSNVDPSGAKPGTFGAQQKPVPLLSFLMSADAGAVVTGIRQSASTDVGFRTNVGFAAGEDGASYTLTLKDTAGATVATATRSLGPSGWEQPGVGALFTGTAIPDDALLVVKVVSGSVDVFDSSIDNLSGDSVVTPITPLPVDIPSAATIGPLGGSVRSSDGALTLKVPAGALGAATPISIAITTNDAPGALGPGYSVSPDGLSFAKPALLGLRYGTDAVPVDEIGGAAVVVLTDVGWAGLSGGKIDTSSRLLLIPLRSTSPAAAPAAARAPLSGTGSTSFATNQGLVVKKPVWLPTGSDTWNLEVVYRTQPSSKGPVFEYELIGTRNVTVKWFPPNFGSFDSLVGPQTGYNAPRQIPEVFSVVKAAVRVTQNANTSYGLSFRFKLIRRNWRLDVFYFLHLTCPEAGNVSVELGGNGAAAYNTFSFRDDLTFHPNAAPAPGAAVTPAMASCKGCQITITGVPGNVQLSSLSGGFQGASGFFLNGNTFQTNALPPYSASSCPSILDDTAGSVEGVNLDLRAILPPRNGIYWPLSNDPAIAHTDTGLGIVVYFEWRSVDGDL